MADGSKRLSSSTKVAVPKVGGAASSTASAATAADLESTLPKAIGGRVRIVTTLDTAIEGTLFTACPSTHLLAINTSTSSSDASSDAAPAALTTTAPQPADYRIVPISQIQSFNVVSLAPLPPADKVDGGPNGISLSGAGLAVSDLAISQLDLAALRRREEDAIRKCKERDAMRGRGVTKEAQELFNYMARQLPTRWDRQNIVILDAVVISPPYSPESCQALGEKQGSLERVRKMLDGFNRKKGQGTSPSPAPAGRVAVTPVPPRKGG